MQFRKKVIFDSSNVQFFVILLGVVLFMIFLSYTPRIMESFFWNQQRVCTAYQWSGNSHCRIS